MRVVNTVATVMAVLCAACSDVAAPLPTGNPSSIPVLPAQSGPLVLESVTLNQGNQTPTGSVGIIAGRPGMLRVVVRALEENQLSPFVRVRLRTGNQIIRDTLIARVGTVPLDPQYSTLSNTWNLQVPASDVVPGLTVEAMVDAESVIPNEDRAAKLVQPLNPVQLPPIKIVFVPVRSTVQGTTGNVSTANVDILLASARKWLPTSRVEAVIHATHTTNLDLSVADNWSRLLSELQALRTIEGASDEYYHGIIGDFPGIPLGGRAYRPPSPTSASRTGVSYDRSLVASETIAHELGHNMGRLHAPCGEPDNADPAFPHSNATIGTPSYDIVSGQLRNPVTSHDFMSYCGPRQPSDYTYQGILKWRMQAAHMAGANFQIGSAAAGHGAASQGLLLSGHLTARGVTLNPASIHTARAALPEGAGPNEIVGLAADGSQLFRITFTSTPVADADEEAFSFFLPLDNATLSSVHRIELRTPRGSAVQRVGSR